MERTERASAAAFAGTSTMRSGSGKPAVLMFGRDTRGDLPVAWAGRASEVDWVSSPHGTAFTLKGYAYDRGAIWNARGRSVFEQALAAAGQGDRQWVWREAGPVWETMVDRVDPVRQARDAVEQGELVSVEGTVGSPVYEFRVNQETVRLTLRKGLVRTVESTYDWGQVTYRLTKLGNEVVAPTLVDASDAASEEALVDAVYFLAKERTLTTTASSVARSVRYVAEDSGTPVRVSHIHEVVTARGLVGADPTAGVRAELTAEGARLTVELEGDAVSFGSLCRIVEKLPKQELRVSSC